jgi:hypothetical protein
MFQTKVAEEIKTHTYWVQKHFFPENLAFMRCGKIYYSVAGKR